MEITLDESLEPTPEQVRYAKVLGKGMLIGLACLFITFAFYIFGVTEPHVPPEEVSNHWTKDVHTYLADTEIEAGWNWVLMVRHSDFINFIGIVMLAGTTIICYISIIPMLFKKKDYIYAVLALLEVFILVIAASGVIAVGH